MKAVVFKGVGEFEIAEKPIPEIKNADDVKLKIIAASICGSDVHMLANPPGMIATPGIILGHECISEVVDVGEGVRNVKIGDRVIMDNNLPCGVCKMCHLGHPNMCTNMNAMGSQCDGVFAEYAIAPERALFKISKDIPLKKAIIAEPLNCVMGAVKKVNLMPGDKCVVLGGGPIGLCFAAALKARGAGKVIVSEVSKMRSVIAGKIGADIVINPLEASLKDEVMRLTDGLGADLIVDSVGSLMAEAVELARPCANILLFGMNQNAVSSLHQIDITSKDLIIRGCYIGPFTLPITSNMLSDEVVDLSRLVTHEYLLEDFAQALDDMRTTRAVKTILYPHGYIEN